MKTWKELAEEARADDYQPGNHWERMLDRHLKANFPALVKELGKQYQDYLQARTNEVMNLEVTMIHQGTDPQAARELAMQDLLPVP